MDRPKEPDNVKRYTLEEIREGARAAIEEVAGLTKVVVTIKLDVYDIIFISLILAAGAASLCI